jgi:trehalose/maltose hydrolase-like predicted phosphorylase
VPVLNEDLVNLPNWLVLNLRIGGEEAIRLAEVEVLAYRQELALRTTVMTRLLRFRDALGRETTLRSRRYLSMAHPNHAGIEWTLTAENWSGCVEVISAIDGRI